MATRLLHISDLHAGTLEGPPVERALATLIERAAPQLVIVSGDLTHRGRREQHEHAAAFLRGLGRALLVIPGNHDIPYTFPARFTRTFREFERQWQTIEPLYTADGLHVVGINSVRAWRNQSGKVHDDALRRAAERLGEAPAGGLLLPPLPPPPIRA